MEPSSKPGKYGDRCDGRDDVESLCQEFGLRGVKCGGEQLESGLVVVPLNEQRFLQRLEYPENRHDHEKVRRHEHSQRQLGLANFEEDFERIHFGFQACRGCPGESEGRVRRAIVRLSSPCCKVLDRNANQVLEFRRFAH